MLIKKPADIRSSEITTPQIYQDRRRFFKLSALTGAAALLAGTATRRARAEGEKLPNVQPGPFGTNEERTPLEDVTRYNNFYEFGTDKSDPALYAHTLRTHPWTVRVEGHCENPGSYALEDFLAPHALQERVYRLRCVEAWSMVIPWVGIPLGDLLKRFQPTSNAKYVEFVTLLDPEQMPGQKSPVLNWPYREGLRIDEAMHPLTLFAVGLYGEVLPNQNGAPLRLVVPWKYGFKSIKSIVAVRFTEEQPVTSWAQQNPTEYGFYANVNPAVDHPRWSQKKERRIGEFFRRETLPFNGYADQVAGLYSGMDLHQYF
ncbi:MAG: protein-methionine-sulfoxide reductase catalytic subunit MsrP [Gammaproteobacteria bacterium]|nr:protein-methionine-sulfoxide reductase catalytic subunit MsrP [Gammaproteobacteria bacterium]MCP5459415.1 protein-methionine-sulfoxide reductase catalytic subunit MsrP [Gammaproteobacteria bacterium]